jgi:hypothetical protein
MKEPGQVIHLNHLAISFDTGPPARYGLGYRRCVMHNYSLAEPRPKPEFETALEAFAAARGLAVRHDSCTESTERHPETSERATVEAARSLEGFVEAYAVSAEDRCGPFHFNAVLVRIRDEDGHVHTRYVA